MLRWHEDFVHLDCQDPCAFAGHSPAQLLRHLCPLKLQIQDACHIHPFELSININSTAIELYLLLVLGTLANDIFNCQRPGMANQHRTQGSVVKHLDFQPLSEVKDHEIMGIVGPYGITCALDCRRFPVYGRKLTAYIRVARSLRHQVPIMCHELPGLYRRDLEDAKRCRVVDCGTINTLLLCSYWNCDHVWKHKHLQHDVVDDIMHQVVKAWH
mmetsp:Transcript_48092/g.112431  ORF Transcript_48092/g.112431 Transcript_48092/m.112431 type:complete len:214 (+) Transcript_48092:673-1314(+)